MSYIFHSKTKNLKSIKRLSGRIVKKFLYTVIYVLLILSLAGYITNITLSPIITFLLLFVHSLRFITDDRKDSLTLSISIIFFTLYAFPSLGMILFGYSNPIETVIAFIIISELFIFSSYKFKKTNTLRNYSRNINNDLLFFSVLVVWMLVAPFILVGNSVITLVAPLSLSAVIFETILSKRKGRNVVIGMALAYAAVLISHILFHWSGYGRLVVGTFFVYLVLLASCYIDVKFRIWQIPLLLPIALFYAQLSRYGNVDNLNTLLMGSAGHHLIVTEDARSALPAEGWAAYVDQYLLLFLSWFPRAIWSDKPLGIGLTSVDKMYGREGFPDTYTQSIGFLGEQYYLLGSYAIVGLLLTTLTLITVRYIIYRVSKGYKAAVIAFDVSLLSFFWGGMGIFGSRVWFLLCPALIYIILKRVKFKPHI